MASEVIAFQVNLRKNANRFSKAYGKYYPEADTKGPRFIINHQSNKFDSSLSYSDCS